MLTLSCHTHLPSPRGKQSSWVLLPRTKGKSFRHPIKASFHHSAIILLPVLAPIPQIKNRVRVKVLKRVIARPFRRCSSGWRCSSRRCCRFTVVTMCPRRLCFRCFLVEQYAPKIPCAKKRVSLTCSTWKIWRFGLTKVSRLLTHF